MFTINDIKWDAVYVDNSNEILRKPDGTYTYGVTDFGTQTIYISRSLRGKLLDKVLLHEICHCVIFSYGLKWRPEDEEKICDFVATYLETIDEIKNYILGISYKGAEPLSRFS